MLRQEAFTAPRLQSSATPRMLSHASNSSSLATPTGQQAAQSQPRSTPRLTQQSASAVFHDVVSHEPRRASTSAMQQIHVHDAAEDSDERPRKRTRFDTELVTSSVTVNIITQEIAADKPLSFPADPIRPRQNKRNQSSSIPSASRRADGINPPAIAVALPNGATADFSPWTGEHAEDVINEQVIKGGYCDKGSALNGNESSTARPLIWPGLTFKNSVPLHTLSLLYTQVLERRQAAGKINAPSSFKPPPRVTVTDTKREAWLRDLANLSIPLRRQSRTIPHGIRGRVLLEQSLLKGIPLQRAVWLAKCVGANELRAFRRKGISGSASAQGETKWTREWTMQVIQFLGDILRSKPEDGWRSRVEYAVKLVTSLFEEGLLEHGYFLDWLISTLESATQDQLPLSLLLIHIFWTRLITIEQRGRRLALGLLAQLSALQDSRSVVFATVRTQLQKLICSLASQAPACLIIPLQWAQFSSLVLDSLQTLPTPGQERLRKIILARNQRLSTPSHTTQQTVNSPLCRLYLMLDQAGLDLDTTQMAEQALLDVPDITVLVPAVLSWAATRFRAGRARANLAAKILEIIGKRGHDITAAILSYLKSIVTVDKMIDESNIINIIRNLTNLGLFSGGQFLQWLISSGALSKSATSKLSSKLLLAFPHQKLSQHLANTRLSLLTRADQTLEPSSSGLISMLKTRLQLQVGWLDDNMLSLLRDMAHADSVSTWAMSTAVVLFKEHAMTRSTFGLLRHVQEALSNVEALQDMLRLAIQSEDFRIIGAAADTISKNAMELAIDGSLKPLTEALVERYRGLRKQQPLDRSAIYAIRSLVKSQNGMLDTVKLLNGDIAIYEQQSLNNVCSPASDSLIGMHAGTLDSDDEIEAVFASGNAMDEHLMRRVLARVTQHAMQNVVKQKDEQSPVCRWLVQLRLLDQGTFDKIAKDHVLELIRARDTAHACAGVYALVAADCFGFQTLIALLDDDLQPEIASRVLKVLARPMLQVPSLSAFEQYHVEQQRFNFRRGQASDMAFVLQKSLMASLDQDTLECVLTVSLELQSSVKHSLGSIARACSGNPIASANIRLLCSSLLFPASKQSPTSVEIAERADLLNIAFCTSYLQCATAQADDTAKQALMSAVTSRSPVWPQLLSSTSQADIDAFHEWAITQLTKPDSESVTDQDLCASIIDITSPLVKQEEQVSSMGRIAVRLQAISKTCKDMAVVRQELLNSFSTLLHAVVLLSQNAPRGEASLQARMQTVLALCSLLAQDILQEYASLLQYIHDVASQVIDKLPSEALPRLLKGLGNAGLHSPSFKSLLGEASDNDCWLTLAGTTRTSSTQQRGTLSRQQSQPSVRVGTPTASQASSSASQQGKLPVANTRSQSGESAIRYAPWVVSNWELMRDATPVVGENDSSISLALVGARKA